VINRNYHPSTNPFIYGPMIRETDKFFGRQVEIEQILGKLSKMQSISIVGERRIGKSSLLFRLSQLPQPLGHETRIVYSDLSDVRDEEGFYTAVCRVLGRAGNRLGYSKLRQIVETERVVLCLDEFETVVAGQNFTISFFNALRSLAQEGRFALVIATQNPLSILCRNKKIATSPFWNIFHRRNLGLVERADAERHIREQSAGSGCEFSECEIEHVIAVAGLYPFYLQMACWYLFEAKIKQTPQWQNSFEQEAEDHFHALWEHLTEQERRAMRWMTEFGDRIPDDRVLEDLKRRGLAIENESVWRGLCPFSEAFEGYIKSLPKPKWWEVMWRRLNPSKVGAKTPFGDIEFEFKRSKEDK
jgi:hypothetical protein